MTSNLTILPRTTITEESESDTQTTYRISHVIIDTTTPTGTHTVIAESPVYGRMLFLDGELQSTAADEHIYHESLVHPAMAAAAAATRVLVVGGGEGATVREVLRWPGATVDWVDYDVGLVALCAEHLGWAPFVYDHPRVRFIGDDIQKVLHTLKPTYDVVILDLPDPDGETGWLYSEEFWSAMRGRVAPGGRLVTHCGPVRPFGGIGDGFRRVWKGLCDGGTTAGFYTMPMPSFQGEWGFWLWAPDGAPFWTTAGAAATLPTGLCVADTAQLQAWASRSLLWTGALQETA
jgi:spermidine synthase